MRHPYTLIILSSQHNSADTQPNNVRRLYASAANSKPDSTRENHSQVHAQQEFAGNPPKSQINSQTMSQALQIPAQKTKRQYSDSFKAQALIALDLNHGNVKKTARELEIPQDTLYSWHYRRSGIHPEIVEMRDSLKAPIADRFEEAAGMYLDRAMQPGAIKKTSGYYALLGASDAIKSAQLLRGQPTSISGSVMSEDERRLRVAELLAGIQARARTPKSDPE